MKGHCHDCPDRESGEGKRGALQTLSAGLVLAAVIFCWSGDASAFRCNNGKGLVSQGDSKARVRIECGKPDDVEKVKSVTRGRSQGETIDTPSGKLRDRVYAEETLAVEKWYYNCGENDFLYVLTFEGDILVKEDTAGRGTGPSRCTY
jgi:hypothetical protein